MNSEIFQHASSEKEEGHSTGLFCGPTRLPTLSETRCAFSYPAGEPFSSMSQEGLFLPNKVRALHTAGHGFVSLIPFHLKHHLASSIFLREITLFLS